MEAEDPLAGCAHETIVRHDFTGFEEWRCSVCAEPFTPSSKLQAYQKLCPSVQDLETGEQLHPESTISVGLGRYRQLLDDADRLADKLNDIRHAWEHAEEIGRMDTYAANTIKEALKL